MQSSNSKPQFGPWLLDQVNSGQYDGLTWVDNNKFRVPWKHNSRKDISDEDCKIFKAWAEASGKIRENPRDKAKWKTNFRCALNGHKKFDMVEDHSKDDDDPHKVYQVLGSEYTHDDQHVPEIPMNQDCPFIDDIYTAENHTDYLNEEMQEELLNHLHTLTLNNQQPDGNNWGGNCHADLAVVPNTYPLQPVHVDPQLATPNNLPPPVPHPYNSVNQDVPVNPSCQPLLYDLEITIHYRNRKMLQTIVSCPRVQLHHQAFDPELQAQDICFPGTEGLVDHKQIEYTQKLLRSVQRGLCLEVRDTGIYAVRLDKCHVFASTLSEMRQPNPQPRKLHQGQEVELLSFQKYIKDLTDFKDQRRGSPEYAVYLCFGEKFPDAKPREKKLIIVKVEPLICRFFHEKAQAEGASSLLSDNISLQISHNSLIDLIYSAFGMPTAP
ncbi:hypothetical protein AGOR_G00001250 [Albula goreensis]|uniref:IRF tryptophan pentad repeat domain-containing protein n=1 Tax=Albula goreensis TaxID=1534307 RepID=A0A8T3E8H4_9TELE|nr:hypothetical protein AGOR_G00001250 [Albula goreensis]